MQPGYQARAFGRPSGRWTPIGGVAARGGGWSWLVLSPHGERKARLG